MTLYATGDCSGTPLATGSAAALGSTGLAIAVGDDTTTTVRATATDAAANTSACSDALTYVEDSTAPILTLTGPGGFTTDTAPQLSGVAGTGARDGDTITVRLYAGAVAFGDPVATLATPRDATTGAYAIRPAPRSPTAPTPRWPRRATRPATSARAPPLCSRSSRRRPPCP